MEDLPEEIGDLYSLTDLHLSMNILQRLPDSIGESSLTLLLLQSVSQPPGIFEFLRARASIAILRISYGNSVCLVDSVSRPDTIPRPCEIETSGFHHMIS